MFFNKKKSKGLTYHLNEAGDRAKVVIDRKMNAEEYQKLLEVFAEHNNLPYFDGKVDHAYESDFLGYKDKCPRCNAATELKLAVFPYATQVASRIATVDGGHFCTACPTVIIDDDRMRETIDKKYEYRGVFAIESKNQPPPGLFGTFNGRKPTIILDKEAQDVGGVVQSVHQPSGQFFMPPTKPKIRTSQKNKSRQRKKAAKKSRRRNRK